ncbi:hypothetical protein V6N12_011664 [Hibiscus sabdariffa]|uniref:Reverse transcriptase zinc-binding domain-containing protein n=1 Tax=Hibiscus sabdariffa TaxID=183260 RepID=A0ABR2B5T7_9ROSI
MEVNGSNESFEEESSGFDSMEELQEAHVINHINVVDATSSTKVLYAKKVVGLFEKGKCACSRRDLIVDNTVVIEDDVIIDRIGLFPFIKFSDHIHEQIDVSMNNIIIDRLLGRSIGYKALLLRIQTLRKLVGEIQLIGKGNDYFLVHFKDVRDYTEALRIGGALGLRFVAVEIEELDNQAHATTNKVLHKQEVRAIVQISVCSQPHYDVLVWHYSNSGEFTFNSGYHRLMANKRTHDAGSSRHDENKGKNWCHIWNLMTPPKIQNFIWKACHNVVPSNENLARRHHSRTSSCFRCGEPNESLEHILFFCPYCD